MKYIKRLTGIILLVSGMLTIQVNAQHVDLVLHDTTITTTATFEATNSIVAGPNFTISNTGNVTFRSSNSITLNPGVTIMLGGVFTAFPGADVGFETENPIIPNGLALKNCPNPFSQATEIRYGLPNDDHVTVMVYDLSGKRIITLLSQKQQAGYHAVVWDGRDETGQEVNGGVYSCLVETGKYAMAMKMVLMK